MAIALKKNLGSVQLTGVDLDANHCKKVLEFGLVEVLDLTDAVNKAGLIIIAIPVDSINKILQQVLNIINKQVVIDIGSAKLIICKEAKLHKSKCRFVASHPMWGTEFSGPESAVKGAFKNKAAVISNKEEPAEDAVAMVAYIYKLLGMHIVYMKAAEHDIHTAYISHVSHITSFALANTVLEKEKEDDKIFELASGGFESTVRLAKSNPLMWVSILNKTGRMYLMF